MTDDIVTRLQHEWNNCPTCLAGLEAAGEIKMLRTEIERLREQLAISKHECQMADDAVQDLQTRLIKAVRGE